MKSLKTTIGMLLVLMASFSSLSARPSHVFWTNCTTDVYETGVGHIDVDNWFTVFNGKKGSLLPPTFGFEVGVASFGNWKLEAGVDYLAPLEHPLFFNAGIGIDENLLLCNAPSFKVGVFYAGTQYSGHRKTDFNIVDVIVGKTLPRIGGRLFIGGYYGNKHIGKDRGGFMVAYERMFCPTEYCDGTEYCRWKLVADYASGKNIIGGGGVGVGYYFTPYISVTTGPTWFNAKELRDDMRWTVQVDISFAMFNHCR